MSRGARGAISQGASRIRFPNYRKDYNRSGLNRMCITKMNVEQGLIKSGCEQHSSAGEGLSMPTSHLSVDSRGSLFQALPIASDHALLCLRVSIPGSIMFPDPTTYPARLDDETTCVLRPLIVLNWTHSP